MENRLDLTLTDVGSDSADLARALLDPSSVLHVRSDADGPGQVRLVGAFPQGTQVLRDGEPVPASAGPDGAVLAVVTGEHRFTLVPPSP